MATQFDSRSLSTRNERNTHSEHENPHPWFRQLSFIHQPTADELPQHNNMGRGRTLQFSSVDSYCASPIPE